MGKSDGVSKMDPKDVHFLIPGTCKYAIVHGKKDFASGIKVKNLKTGRLSWIIWA